MACHCFGEMRALSRLGYTIHVRPIGDRPAAAPGVRLTCLPCGTAYQLVPAVRADRMTVAA